MLLSSSTRSAFKRAGLAGSDHAEIRVERNRLHEFVWRGGAFESATTSHDVGCCARVSGALGSSFASATGFDTLAVLRAAVRGTALLRAPGSAAADREPVVGDFPSTCGERPESVDPQEKAELLAGYQAAALAAHPSVTGALVHYRESLSEVDLTTTDGTSAHFQRRDLTLQVTVYAADGGHPFAGSVSVGSGGDFDVVRGLTEDVEQAAASAVDLLRAPVPEDGVLDVVCDGPLAGAWAHETIGHLAEADHHIGDPGLQAALRPGRTIGPDALTITDTPARPGARGYIPIDDEATLARDVPLVQHGVVVEPRLHDQATAAAFGEVPTGNGRAVNFRHPPLPRLRTLVVAPGTHSDDDLVAGVRRGLLARGLLGGQTDRRGFTFTPARCHLIADGRVGRLVRGVVLSGGVLDAFATIDAVGDRQWRGDTSAGCGKQGQYPLPVSAWSPAVRLRGLRVRCG